MAVIAAAGLSPYNLTSIYQAGIDLPKCRRAMANSTPPTGRIVIAGGTGFLGLNLARYLGGFHCETVLLSAIRPRKIRVGGMLPGTPARRGIG